MESQLISLERLESNDGQLNGVPANPRIINEEEFDALKRSIQDNPEMLELRELIAVPHKDKFVVICGNMRLRALRELGYKEAHCKIVKNATPKQIRAYVIKDNLSFGQNDYDELANWDCEELKQFGLDIEDTIAGDDIEDEKYTKKLDGLIYEPTMDEKPDISELYNDEKFLSLSEKIAKIKDEKLKKFLDYAAHRFVKFDYSMIAEFYAHSDEETKTMFRDLLLVIVDIGQAIESGVCRFEDRLEEFLKNESEK